MKIPIKLLLIVFFSVAVTLAAQKKKVEYKEDKGVVDPNLHLLYPNVIEKMLLKDFFNYPQKGYGYTVGYKGDNGFKASVYAYDKEHQVIPNGYDSKPVKDEMQMVTQALRFMEKKGTYKDLEITGMDMFTPKGSKLTFLRNSFSYIEKHKGGETPPLESYSFITGYGNNFIKIRFTYPKAHMVEGRKKAEKFIEKIAVLLKKSQEAFKKEGLGFTIFADLPEAENNVGAIWFAYLLTRQNYILENNDDYISAPGIILPRFKEELDARSGMISVWKEIQAKDKSFKNKYFEELGKVKDKDYLKEYIWTFHKRDSWKQPKELKLKEFAKWRKQNIPEHKPQTMGAIGYEPQDKAKKK